MRYLTMNKELIFDITPFNKIQKTILCLILLLFFIKLIFYDKIMSTNKVLKSNDSKNTFFILNQTVFLNTSLSYSNNSSCLDAIDFISNEKHYGCLYLQPHSKINANDIIYT